MAVSGTSSSSMSSMLGVQGKGIGGLATGLDTDSLVAALTAGTKNKITKQGQEKQLLNWKMTAYRGLSTALRAFQSKSFSYAGGTSGANTNIMSSSFFSTYKATSNSSKVSVSTTGSSTAGSFEITKVQQLASAETIASKNKLSASLNLENMYDGRQVGVKAFTGETITLNVDGNEKTIKLDALNSSLDATGKLDLAAFQTGLQDILNTTYGTKNVGGVQKPIIEVSKDTATNNIKLDSDASKIIIGSNSSVLGVDEGETNRITTKSTKLGDIDAFKNLQGDTFKFTINGKEISASKSDTLTSLMSKVSNSGAGVNMTYSQFTDEFTITSKSTGAGANIDIRDTQGNLMNEIFGSQGGGGIGTDYLTTGLSVTGQDDNIIKKNGLVSGSQAMKDLAKAMKNMEFEMTIDGVTKIVKADTSKIDITEQYNGTYEFKSIIEAVNKGITQAFGVDTNVQFTVDNGKATLSTSPYTGDPSAFSITSNTKFGSGTMMEVLGITGPIGNSNFDVGYSKNMAATNSIVNTMPATDRAISVTIDGVTKQLNLTKENLTTSNGTGNSQFNEYLNGLIKYEFGADVANKVKFSQESDGSGGFKLKVATTDSATSVKIGSATNLQPGQTDMYADLGFTGTETTNKTATGVKLGDFRGIAGSTMTTGNKNLTITSDGVTKTVTYSDTMSMQDFMSSINDAFGGKVSAGIKDGQFSINAKNGNIKIEDDGDFLKNFSGINNVVGGKNTYQTAAASADTSNRKVGQNAEVVIDGRVVTSFSNTFDYNGASITVNDVSAAGDAPIKVNVSSDPADVVKRITDWMTDYNALVYTLNTAINETKNGDYKPLTDEQKADMTQDQIKTWDSEAKKGLLRSDTAVRGVLAELRESFFQKVESAGISLFDVGIVTKSNTNNINDNGQLEFDTIPNSQGTGEERLRKMLETNPDKVRMLFTDPDQGVAVKMNAAIDRAANESSFKRGSLVRIAGTEKPTADNTSQLGDKISAIDKFVNTLKLRMESEHNRYWKRFSALEMSVQKMNAQSSWLTQGQ